MKFLLINGKNVLSKKIGLRSIFNGNSFAKSSNFYKNSQNDSLDSAESTEGSQFYSSQKPKAKFEQSISNIYNPFVEDSNFQMNYSLESFNLIDTKFERFSDEICSILTEPIDENLIEIKPDGSCYLPEVQYRRILNRAFGLGGWVLVPRGPHSMDNNVLSREYGLFAIGKFISQSRGHAAILNNFQNPAMCTESVKSNALMRCCKDLGIASSLWDNSIVAEWKSKFAIKKSITDNNGRQKFIWEKKK